MDSLRGRVALITGAASGIGRALARELALRGCDLALVDIDGEGLRATAEGLALFGRRISLHQADVARAGLVEALPAAVLATHGRVDLLVNNAGVSLAGPFEGYTAADLEWIIGVNLWGALHCCRVFLPLLRERRGWVVNVASDFGLVGLPSKTAYCTTKFALRGFSEALRAELHGSGVRVICVYPGAVDTQLIRRSRTADPRKRELEAAFVAQRGIPPVRVARRIASAIERGQGRVLIGGDTWIIDLCTRLFPGLTNALIARFHAYLPFI